NNGENCLILACYQNANIKTLDFLITDLNLNVNHRDKHTESCLVRLCEKCADFEIIKSMIERHGANPLDRDVDGNNCLGILLINDNESPDHSSLLEIVKYMIEVQKIDSGSVNHNHENYLHILCNKTNLSLEIIDYF